MKRFIPLKYVLGMAVLFLILPVSLILLINLTLELTDITSRICIFLGCQIIAGPFVYCWNQENACIIIQNNTIKNCMSDGTLNFRWTEEIEKIQRIELISQEKKEYWGGKVIKRKVILIDFGFGNIKYICVDLFTNGQIEQIINYLSENHSYKH